MKMTAWAHSMFLHLLLLYMCFRIALELPKCDSYSLVVTMGPSQIDPCLALQRYTTLGPGPGSNPGTSTYLLPRRHLCGLRRGLFAALLLADGQHQLLVTAKSSCGPCWASELRSE